MAVYRLVIRGTVSGQSQQISRYWDSVGGTPDLQALVDAVGQSFADSIENLVSSETVWNDIHVSLAAAGSLGTVLVPDSFPAVGANSPTTQMPPHDAVLLRYSRGVLAYPRQNRNRISGFDEAQVSGGTLTAGAITSWGLVALALSATYNLGLVTWSPVLWSAEYQTYGDVESRNVSSVISTQRTRRVGSGG